MIVRTLISRTTILLLFRCSIQNNSNHHSTSQYNNNDYDDDYYNPQPQQQRQVLNNDTNDHSSSSAAAAAVTTTTMVTGTATSGSVFAFSITVVDYVHYRHHPHRHHRPLPTQILPRNCQYDKNNYNNYRFLMVSSSETNSDTDTFKTSDNDPYKNADTDGAIDDHDDTTRNDGIIHEVKVPLPNGTIMQVICGIPKHYYRLQYQQQRQSRDDDDDDDDAQPLSNVPPILLLLHGSFHSAWCYHEHYIPYFTNNNNNNNNKQQQPSSDDGYITIAPSWRGTAGTVQSSVPPTTTTKRKIKIRDHVDDLYYLLHAIPSILQTVFSSSSTSSRSTDSNTTMMMTTTWNHTTPVPQLRLYVICHSFGGIVLMKYLEKYYGSDVSSSSSSLPSLAGIVTLCSIPPSGNGPMTVRFLRRSIRQSYDITVGFAMKRCCTDVVLCRTLFFDNDIDDTTIQRYQSYFIRDSKQTIDLLDLSKQLPSKYTTSSTTNPGVARFVDESFPPCLVIGARDDYIVDYEALIETARYLNCYNDSDVSATTTTTTTTTKQTPQVTLIDSSHDVMLGHRWMNGAMAIAQWIQQKEQQQHIRRSSKTAKR